VHEHWPQIEGTTDNRLQYVGYANAMRVLRANFKSTAEIILYPGLPDKTETSTQIHHVLFKTTLYAF
jgi:hypothetical protein